MLKLLLSAWLCFGVFASSAGASLVSLRSQESLSALLDVLGRPFAPVTPDREITPLCRRHSEVYLRALSKLEPWALHMYDASTKIPSSLIAGNILQMGNYDQCIAVEGRDQDSEPGIFEGQHCTAAVTFSMPTSEGESAFGNLLLAAANASGVRPGKNSATYEWAYCVPSSCTAKDVQVSLGARLALLGQPHAPSVLVDPQRCLTASSRKQNTPLTSAEIGFLCLIMAAVYILIASTLYDVLYYSKREGEGRHMSRLQQTLVAFSLKRNGSTLLSTSVSGDTLGCINGLRVSSTFWVVMLHSSYIAAIAPTINMAVVPKLGDSLENMVVMNATLSTDTFFLLSGTLLCMSFLRSAGRSRFNPLAFYWHRYIRLTPVYAVVIWFYATFLIRSGTGPRWDKIVGADQDFCVANWWTNLVYVNNYVDIARPCMNQTWYLAVDMQLFWLSPLLLMPMFRWPRLGRFLLCVMLLLSMAVPFTITYLKRLTGAMLYTLDQQMLGAVYVFVYSRVYNRGGPYLLGLALGSILFETRGKAVRIPKVLVLLGWLLASVTCLLVLFGVYGFYQSKHEYSAVEAAFYAGMHRTAWAAGVAWIVFACVKGYGGPVNALLSWRGFIPLGRLSYCVYLSHYAVLLINEGLQRSPGYFNAYFVLHGALGTICISLIVSTALALAFEIPFMELDRVLLPRASLPKKTTSDTDVSSQKKVLDSENPRDRVAVVSPTPSLAIGCSNESRILHGYDNAGFEPTQ